MIVAIIGGSGDLGLVADWPPVAPPPSRYGEPSAAPRQGQLGGAEVLFLGRHGEPRHIAPHLINNRANIDVLKQLGARAVFALNTVGGISAAARPGSLFVPDQLIDYTWGREHTFSDAAALLHADFADPFDAGLRRDLLGAAGRAGIDVVARGVYGCTQGPRFETAAEIERMARDGCDLVGMTGMPEAALAREWGLPYAMLSLVVNPAAGRAEDPFDTAAITRVAAEGMARIETLLARLFQGSVGR